VRRRGVAVVARMKHSKFSDQKCADIDCMRAAEGLKNNPVFVCSKLDSAPNISALIINNIPPYAVDSAT
jgi:hypothetical protein